MELEKGKTADRKGTVKAVWQKTGMALIKKKNKILLGWTRFGRQMEKYVIAKVKPPKATPTMLLRQLLHLICHNS
jgi:hypothetical protein